jgi:leucyl-tRNA synthetase
MEYRFRDIEKKWQDWWKANNVYKVSNDSAKPKYYVLDMFPYPSGTGLHVGHPLGYIASDIYARFKRLKGFNVLHPMGYDSFGLPAEQYAIEHGIHPAVSTENNINNFRKQLDNIGFCFDWSREVRTSEPNFYKWTQWIFLQLFNSYFCHTEKKALPISKLIAKYETRGALPKNGEPIPGKHFSAEQWIAFSEKEKADILMRRRLAYCGYGEVNWCEALGTVLANDEVINGVSERGGHPVVKKTLRQWYLRITEYADRLLEGLNTVDFSESMKEMQSNWIGKSSGAEIDFEIGLTPNSSPGGEGSDEFSEKRKLFKTADKIIWETLKSYGRANRKNQTEAEDAIWQRIRNNKLGVKVRRQHAIEGYIVDFALLQVNLVIEIDGKYHDEAEQMIFDEIRTKCLNSVGLSLLRFTNDEVLNDIEFVINKIKTFIEQESPKREQDAAPLSDRRGVGGEAKLKVYTTRPDTIFGVDFMVIAPEHELVEEITTPDQKKTVDEYIAYVKSRSERERMAEKKITGVFTGSYAKNPFNGRAIPIWISEYVLAGYGTGAIMGVPCGDERDNKFAKHFNIPITNIIGSHYNGEEANPTKDAILENSGFINGMVMKDAIDVVINKLQEWGIGVRKVNYKMRDAAFSRQRYWGEPFPIIWKDGIAYPLDESELPVLLPQMEDLKPGPDGEGPLSNLTEWKNYKGGIREVNTMPGYAGSSWYFLRYMDPDNDKEFCSRKASDYWGQVDLYIGGTEHAVGHLLYSRMWTKFLFDLGLIAHEEPYKRLMNQGMIQGSSRFVYRVHGSNKFVSYGLKDQYSTDQIHVNVNIVDGVELDTEEFKKWKGGEFADAEFILEDGKYICGVEVEKMSKSKFNTVNPDDLVVKYGADTFRMYEMFLGPVEMSKPWDTKGIEGVHRFLKKLWRLFYDELKGKVWNEEKATDAELKVLHKTIKKIEEDTERFSFNTGVSTFMICVNDLTELKCYKKEVLEQLLILLAPYAPHISEELWSILGNSGTILDASFPKWNDKYLKETSKAYPVAINGKTRTELTLALDITQQQVEEIVMKDAIVTKWLEGKQPKKIIYVKNKMINVVV